MKCFRFLLFPFSLLYAAVTSLRNFLFEIEIFKHTFFDIPVIVVGNLSVGGTGKTPQIEYLIRLLKGQKKVAVLSRGYRRKTTGFVLVNASHSAEDVGDEPMQYFKKFNGIEVAVDVNRVVGIEKLKQQKTPDIVLLDDAFQHRKVKGSFYILLTKFDDLFTSDFVLPMGNLRENRRGAKRSDVILVTKCPSDLSENKQKNIQKRLKKYRKPVFFTIISYSDTVYGTHQLTLTELKNYGILLITGIANPTPLLDFLTKKQLNFQHLQFADHHHFSENEIRNIEKKFDALKTSKKIIITTEKDFTRLEKKLKNLSYLPIETSFLGTQHIAFNKMILLTL